MGEPVRIDDLARLMIRLTGLEVRTPETPEGDIAVVYTGLRPGEKLYEELLIGANTKAPEHPRILRSDEPFLPRADLERELGLLKAAMDARDVETMHSVLMRTVEGYHSEATPAQDGEQPRSAWSPSSRTLH
jgi:FlaA1/EpsC-like NDP-sugar epimerase